MTHFVSFSNFWTMNGYAPFVWSAWLMALIVWVSLTVYACQQKKSVSKQLISQKNRLKKLKKTYSAFDDTLTLEREHNGSE